MLTTLEKVKKVLSVEDDSQDGTLTLQILAASQAVENHCKRSFRRQTYIEIHSGGWNYISLRNYPVIEITSIKNGNEPVNGYQILSDGMVYRDKWPSGAHNLTVTYEAGYVLPSEATTDNPRTLPEAVELACIFLVQHFVNTPVGVKSERVGDISVSYSDYEGELPAVVISLLNPYVGRWV
ncbi:phage gp6-like head-tail connector protein [Paenibacillus albiflavus]|uniref:Phage gp6-like head-tail connector protein n=1 Tax=Paenibacillus albiflavus TaxID=2545760 RepID=A0A4R4EAP5_9BACL|nr:phage head-tail connector protein [Paenibacillus albiflavus]TCZ76173.1 phage gp6-like head-tail connector protein [Paenibacillus albiflavus]